MSTIKLRTVEERDFEKLSVFLAEGFPTRSVELWKQRFKLWWDLNPFMNSSISRGWVLESKNSEIIGFMGNIPIKFHINGREGLAAAASAWYVQPAFQGIQSILLLLAFLKQEKFDIFLSTTPSEKVKKIDLKLGFLPVNLPYNSVEYWWIINYEQLFSLFLEKRLRFKMVSKALKILFVPSKLIAPLILSFKLKKIHQHLGNEYKCSICSFCDSSFTELWEKNKRENVTSLYRDAVTLNWLCSFPPLSDVRYLIKCEHKQSNKNVGYFILDIKSPRNSETKVIQLKDIYVPQAKEKIILSLISFSINLAVKKGAAAIKFWAPNAEINKILKKYIKMKRTAEYPYYYKFNNIRDLNIGVDHEFIPSLIDPDRGII
jgi:hypothetical protein